MILMYLQHYCVVIRAKVSPTPEHPKPKSMHLNGKKNYTLATVAETGARQRDILEKIRINVHTIKASEEDSKDRILEEQERQLISKDKGVIVWPLLCQIQNLGSLKKMQQYLQVFNLPFQIDLCLLHQVIKKHKRGGK